VKSGFAQSEGSSNAKEERVAVLALRNRIQMSKEEVDYLTGLVRQIISKRMSRKYLIMTQENIEVLLPPDTNLEDCVSNCQVETGRTIGARYIITGDVLRFGSSLRLTLRMHDTKSGRLLASEVAKAKALDELEAPTERAVEALVNQVDGASKPRETTSSARDDDYERDSDRRSSRYREPTRDRPLTRRERLLRRARAAEAERRRRQDDRFKREQRRLEAERARKRAQREKRRAREERLAKQRASREQSRAESKESSLGSGLSPITYEASFGVAQVQCADQCDGVEENGSGFDFALSYNIIPPKSEWGWLLSLDMRFAHATLGDPFGMSESFTYDGTYLTVGALGGFQLGRFIARAMLGVGTAVGNLDYQGSGDFQTYDFESVSTLLTGAELGWRINDVFMVSLYQQRFTPGEDVEVCDFFSDTCSSVTLPSLNQVGARLSLTF
jgi:TolB-like protein